MAIRYKNLKQLRPCGSNRPNGRVGTSPTGLGLGWLCAQHQSIDPEVAPGHKMKGSLDGTANREVYRIEVESVPIRDAGVMWMESGYPKGPKMFIVVGMPDGDSQQ